MYDIGLPSGKTLYQIQMERILRLEELSQRLTGTRGRIQMYIMTSEATKEPTRAFLDKKKYFGLCQEQVTIFEQRVIPAFDNEGKFILESRSKLARSPDGNGGLYWALKHQGVLADLETKDVRFLHVYCVDNVLVKVADPVFMGYCIDKKAGVRLEISTQFINLVYDVLVCRVWQQGGREGVSPGSCGCGLQAGGEDSGKTARKHLRHHADFFYFALSRL